MDQGRLVLGTAQLGMKYGIKNRIGKPPLKKSYEIIQTAWNKNIRFFDTAYSYGESESILGKIFKGLEIAGKVSVISKISGCLNKVNEKEVLKGIDSSLKRLNLGCLYGLLLHDPGNLDFWDSNASQIMRAIKKNNMAEKVGVSVYSYKDAMRVLERDDFEIVQIPFNIFDQSYYSKGIFREAEKRNKTVFIRSIFLQGLLLMEQEELGEDKKNFIKYLQARDTLCARFDLTKKELAIGYVKKRASGAYIIFGAEEPSQVEETVQIFEKADINDEIIKEIEQRLPVSNEDIINPSNWSK